MPVKYHCPQCERRFIDWGAEKLNYICPDCTGTRLMRVGGSPDDPPSKRPSLRKRPMAAARVSKTKPIIDPALLGVDELQDDVEGVVDDSSEDDTGDAEEIPDAVEDDDVDAETVDDDADELEEDDDDEEEDEDMPQVLDFGEGNSVASTLSED